MGTQTLLLALDSIEPALMTPWLEAGRLPALAGVFSNAWRRPIRNFPAFGNGAYWPSLNTGQPPAQHGRHFIRQLVPGTYRIAPFDMCSGFRAEPFWARLDRAGKRVAVIDAIRTPIVNLRSGIATRNWRAHDSDGTLETRPEPLAAKLIERFGADPFMDGSDRYLRHNPGHAAFLGVCRDRAEQRTAWCNELLRGSDWDLFYVAYSEPHDVGHLCWHLHDTLHPAHDPVLQAECGDPLLDTYRHLDQCVAKLIEAAGHEAQIIVLTGPGMEGNASGNHLLDKILFRLDRNARGVPSADARHWLPGPVYNLLRRARNRLQGPEDERKRAASTFFALPNNDNSGAIRINLRDREPSGRIRHGDDFERTMDKLERDLGEIRDDAGQLAVHEFVRTDEPASGALPDLQAVWNRSCDFRAIQSPAIGRLTSSYQRERTGDHTDRGEIAVAGRTPHWLGDLPPTLDPAMAGRALQRLCSDVTQECA